MGMSKMFKTWYRLDLFLDYSALFSLFNTGKNGNIVVLYTSEGSNTALARQYTAMNGSVWKM